YRSVYRSACTDLDMSAHKKGVDAPRCELDANGDLAQRSSDSDKPLIFGFLIFNGSDGIGIA
ncbi:MAG: hypothetical protein ACRYGG_12540, partial [Janthinobacterium lividum]